MFLGIEYKKSIISPTHSAPALDPIFYIDNIVHYEPRAENINKVKHERGEKYANNFSRDILPLGQVSLELAESPIGEKLILVGNPTSKHVGRRRVVSLCQSGMHHTAIKVLKPPRILKCLSNDEDFDYESIKQYKDVGYQNISDAKDMGYQISICRQERIDRLNSIHEYFTKNNANINQSRRTSF